jgi:hypothetical protein
LNWIQIQLKTIGTQIGGKCIQYLFMNMLLEKTFNTQIWKDTFPCLFTWEWANVWRFEEPEVVLPKPTSMNHHHSNFMRDFTHTMRCKSSRIYPKLWASSWDTHYYESKL